MKARISDRKYGLLALVVFGVMPFFALNYSPLDKFCSEDPNGDRIILDRIHVDRRQSFAASNQSLPTVLCCLPIIKSEHSRKALDVYYTWGKRCDKLIFASNASDPRLGAFKVKVPYTGYDWLHLWQKEREAMRYIWETYGHSYDWFLKADVDTYIIMENSRQYLSSEEIRSRSNEALILGRRFSMRANEESKLSHNTTLRQDFLKRSNNIFRC